ncbi:hypothetical protein BDV37DRAFT_289506 [Aspergillus pseudonomiae]|uniref:Chromate transporter-domain-containing protein n=1 Tax=Aspergillus pseudonomiae TaxID=1506151 RepID=A0A5N7CT59_9EURO|nr:uncharacterized protein BDV37DRAFT_289506 [Aspergillus pseudonomiae]KAE8397334.1 hypothetical protein BDV37DRAFT_289506 [Aspergillus pseudonomiae]
MKSTTYLLTALLPLTLSWSMLLHLRSLTTLRTLVLKTGTLAGSSADSFTSSIRISRVIELAVPTEATRLISTTSTETGTRRAGDGSEKTTGLVAAGDLVPTVVTRAMRLSRPQNTREKELNMLASGSEIAGYWRSSFIAILVSRAKLSTPPLVLNVFATIYLAGTVMFGGGPVVIPLLRSYVIDPGWVSSRDFLIGLAILQAFPGPNFNVAVFLGALALRTTSHPTVVGLVFTVVDRLWEIGYLAPLERDGQSLAKDPWWVVVSAVTYAESAWFEVRGSRFRLRLQFC